MKLLNQAWSLDPAQVAGCPAVMSWGNVRLIITGTSSGEVVALDASGRQRWRTVIDGRISTWPVVDELRGLGPSILVASEEGAIACVSPRGKVRWRAELEAPLTSFNSIGVLRGTEDVSVVATDRLGRATGLSDSGEIVWQFHTYRYGLGPAAIGDLDGDGRDEIVFSAGDAHIYCLGSDGSLRWTAQCDRSAQYSGPVLADLGRGPCVMAGAEDDLVRCLSPEGKLLWTQRGVGAGSVEISLSIADINGDGARELVYTHAGRAIEALDGNGRLLWHAAYGGGDQPFGPSIADINGDGAPELLLTQRRGPTLRVLDHNGQLLEEHDIPGGMVGAPVIADVDGDGRLEVLVVPHQTGRLICYRTQGPSQPGAVWWPTSRGDFDGRANRLLNVPRATVQHRPTRKLALPRLTPPRLHLGTNHVRYAAPATRRTEEANPVEVLLRGPDGIAHLAVLHAESDSAPLEILDTGTYHLQASVRDPRTGEVARKSEILRGGLFEDELAEGMRLLSKLESLDGKVKGLDALGPSRRLAWSDLEARVAAYGSLPRDGRRAMVAEVARTLAGLARAVACRELAQEAIKRNPGAMAFLAFAPEHPWAPFDPQADFPQGVHRRLSIHTDGGGHDAAIVQLANLRDQLLDVRAWVDPLTREDGRAFAAREHLLLRQVTWVPTASGRMGPDALPELGDAGTLALGPSSSARLWIDVDTGELAPGTYTTTLHLRALVPADATWDIPVEWTVAPVALPSVMPVKFCNWGYVNSSPLREIAEEAVRDMQSHHTSVFVLTGDWLPKATYDAQGRLSGDVDWQNHDWILDRLRPQDSVLLTGTPVLPEEGAPGQGSPEWEKAFATFLPRWVEHLASKGLGYDRWAFYPVDEPGLLGGKLIDELERQARYYKQIDPNAQVYTDPFKGMTVADMKRVLDLVDIWQPNFGTVVSEPSRERVNFLKSTGKPVWTYEAAGGVKDMAGVAYYWQVIWTAWELGLTGVGFWSYCTRPYDLWQGPNPNGADWEMVYQGATRPVPSIRWQGIRIGIEDYARLWRLKQRAADARHAGFSEWAERADRLLRDVAAEARSSWWNPALVAKLRRKVIELTCSSPAL